MSTIQLPELYEDKLRCLELINRYLTDNRMGYIKLPTGWGKTLLAKHFMRQYYEDGKAVLFLVSKNNQLLDQTFYSDEKSKVRLFPNSVALSSGNKKIDAPVLENQINGRSSGIVVFASLETILSKSNSKIKIILQKCMDLVVIDEIHNFIDNRGNKFIEGISENTQVLGMTATPFQGVVGNVKFVDDISGDMKEIFRKTLPECILDDQLSKLNYSIVDSHQSVLDVYGHDVIEELKKENPTLSLDGGTPKGLDMAIQRTHLAKRIYLDPGIGIDKDSKTLIFCAPVRNVVVNGLEENERVNAFHAKLCAAVFNGEIQDRFDSELSFNNCYEPGKYKQAAYLSSDLSQKQRKDLLDEFRKISKPPCFRLN